MTIDRESEKLDRVADRERPQPTGFFDYLGEAIWVERFARGMTQAQLAYSFGEDYRPGVSAQWVCDIEKNVRSCTFKTLARFAEVFGVKPSDLVAAAERIALREAKPQCELKADVTELVALSSIPDLEEHASPLNPQIETDALESWVQESNKY